MRGDDCSGTHGTSTSRCPGHEADWDFAFNLQLWPLTVLLYSLLREKQLDLLGFAPDK